jgi:alcohol dehydrogenase YqhD (iron-dependent ADH family)
MKRLSQGIDQNGVAIIGAIPQSDTINAYVFSGAGTASDTVPTGANLVLIAASQNVDVFVKIGGSATVPGSNITNGSASEANPMIRWLQGATSVGIAVSASCIVTLSYFS